MDDSALEDVPGMDDIGSSASTNVGQQFEEADVTDTAESKVLEGSQTINDPPLTGPEEPEVGESDGHQN